MDAIVALLKEHASLRRRLIELENKLGPERKAGWDDQADIDLGAFRRAAKDLLDEMLAHESREEGVLAQVWSLRAERPEFVKRVAQAHESLNCLTGLLRAAAECCDGRHVYSVRTVVARLREAMVSHLVYEECSVFPLVRRPLISPRGARSRRAPDREGPSPRV